MMPRMYWRDTVEAAAGRGEGPFLVVAASVGPKRDLCAISSILLFTSSALPLAESVLKKIT